MMSEDDHSNPGMFVTWKDMAAIIGKYEKRIGRVEGYTKFLIAVGMANITLNVVVLIQVAEKLLGK